MAPGRRPPVARYIQYQCQSSRAARRRSTCGDLLGRRRPRRRGPGTTAKIGMQRAGVREADPEGLRRCRRSVALSWTSHVDRQQRAPAACPEQIERVVVVHARLQGQTAALLDEVRDQLQDLAAALLGVAGSKLRQSTSPQDDHVVGEQLARVGWGSAGSASRPRLAGWRNAGSALCSRTCTSKRLRASSVRLSWICARARA